MLILTAFYDLINFVDAKIEKISLTSGFRGITFAENFKLFLTLLIKTVRLCKH